MLLFVSSLALSKTKMDSALRSPLRRKNSYFVSSGAVQLRLISCESSLRGAQVGNSRCGGDASLYEKALGVRWWGFWEYLCSSTKLPRSSRGSWLCFWVIPWRSQDQHKPKVDPRPRLNRQQCSSRSIPCKPTSSGNNFWSHNHPSSVEVGWGRPVATAVAGHAMLDSFL